MDNASDLLSLTLGLAPVLDQIVTSDTKMSNCNLKEAPSHHLLTTTVSLGEEEARISAKCTQNCLPVNQGELHDDLSGDGQSSCQESSDR